LALNGVGYCNHIDFFFLVLVEAINHGLDLVSVGSDLLLSFADAMKFVFNLGCFSLKLEQLLLESRVFFSFFVLCSLNHALVLSELLLSFTLDPGEIIYLPR